MLENLITDRTLSDVQRWLYLRNKGYDKMTAAEKTEWNNGLKGAYNITDLNRVGNALKYLQNRLVEAGYLVGIEFTPKTDWNGTETITTADFAEYINAVATVRGALSRLSTTPPAPPNTGSLDFQGANDIEQILIDVEYLINKMQEKPLYCGELYTGEIGGTK